MILTKMMKKCRTRSKRATTRPRHTGGTHPCISKFTRMGKSHRVRKLLMKIRRSDRNTKNRIDTVACPLLKTFGWD